MKNVSKDRSTYSHTQMSQPDRIRLGKAFKLHAAKLAMMTSDEKMCFLESEIGVMPSSSTLYQIHDYMEGAGIMPERGIASVELVHALQERIKQLEARLAQSNGTFNGSLLHVDSH